MTRFPVRYDRDANTIILDGSGGASIMLTFLFKAKFGEAFDPEVLFHEPLAKIMADLQKECLVPPQGGGPGPFTAEHLHIIAEAILNQSYRSGWWDMSREGQIDYLRNVIAAPHPMSDEQVDAVFDGVESGLFNRRRVVEIADQGKV